MMNIPPHAVISYPYAPVHGKPTSPFLLLSVTLLFGLLLLSAIALVA